MQEGALLQVQEICIVALEQKFQDGLAGAREGIPRSSSIDRC